MKRVQGASKNAAIIIAGFIAGLVIWLQVVSTQADAAASIIGVSPQVVQEQLQVVNASLPNSLPALTVPDVEEENTADSESASLVILTDQQKQHLADVAEKYIAVTSDDKARIVRSLNIVKDGGDLTNVCGPLALAILRDARLVDPYAKLRDFWLLNPDTNRKLLDLTFPSDQYLHFQFEQALNEMDWNEFPLKEGDFLYLYAGPGGTFEHMLAVSRVDAQGRAYSVTNHATADGFVIDEIMLYDPNQNGTGMFYEWANRKNNKFGVTGLGGFEVWRVNQPRRERSVEEEAFARELDSVMEEAGGDWYGAIARPDGGMLYERLAGVPVDIGSMVKLPVAMLFFKTLEKQGITPNEYADYLKNEGPGRSYEQLLKAMFFHSEVNAINTLLDEVRYYAVDVEMELVGWGLKNTNLDNGKSTAADLMTLYKALYSGSAINSSAKDYILDLMDKAAEGKDSRLGRLLKTNPQSLAFYNRRGSTLDTVVAIGDSALVSVPVVDGEDAYIVVLLGYFSDDSPTTDQALVEAIESMSQIFWSNSRK